MSINKSILIVFCTLFGLSFAGHAELQDQGLNSIMLIIDKAIDELNTQTEGLDEAATEAELASKKNASKAVVNLSKTLGTLSYSRLQCGEASVLAEFTQRVRLMPEQDRDAMRDAFQSGFDQSKKDTVLLSEDECKRLTESRNRADVVSEANVAEEKTKNADNTVVEEVQEAPPEDPKLRYLRVAELSGQLAYKRKFCQDEKVFNRDYNNYIGSIPEEIQEEVKTAYWKGYKHGKRLNKNLNRSQC